MNDPYKVLGISPNSTDEEINKAYKRLAKKYHPDYYIDSSLAGLATKKMQEINIAYDQIRKQRAENINNYGNNNYYNNNYNNNSYNNNYNNNYNNSYAGSTTYYDVRMMIQSGRISDADQILSGVPTSNRNAEWHFLKGTILYRKGWSDQAFQHFKQARDMDPNNMEYAAAINEILARQNGNFGGYSNGKAFTEKESYKLDCLSCDDCCDNSADNSMQGCDDICTTLCWLDFCCECAGGDCIDCC